MAGAANSPLALADVAGMLGAGTPGAALQKQQQDQTEEEKRKKRLGLDMTPAVQSVFGMGAR